MKLEIFKITNGFIINDNKEGIYYKDFESLVIAINDKFDLRNAITIKELKDKD